jgi:multiple sugar transport system permease protein
MMSEERITKTKAFLIRILGWTVMIIMASVMIIPFIWMISTSAKPQSFLAEFPPRFITPDMSFSAYRTLFSLLPMAKMLLNSIIVTVFVTLGQIAAAATAAYAFARIPFKGSNLLLVVFLAVFMVPTQVILTPLFILTRNLGWLNSYQGIIFPLMAMRISFGIFLLKQYFHGIPVSIEESAFLDGANHGTIFLRIVLPLVKPALATMLVLTVMDSWNTLLWPLLVARDTEMMTLTVGLSSLRGRYNTEWNLVMAGAVISVLPIILTFIAAQKQFIEGMARTGLKG